LVFLINFIVFLIVIFFNIYICVYIYIYIFFFFFFFFFSFFLIYIYVYIYIYIFFFFFIFFPHKIVDSEKVENLLDHITSKIANNLEIFKICGNYWIWKKDYRKALDYKLKAYRITLHDPNLLNDTTIFEKTATLAIELVEDYQNYGSKNLENGEPVLRDWIYQSKMILRTLIGRTKVKFIIIIIILLLLLYFLYI